ncbi:MAG TPA: glutamyl-tRNA reductase [Chloroflexota bacterium]
MAAHALPAHRPAPAVDVDAAPLVMVGIDHVAVPLAIRERLAAACADLPTVIAHLRKIAREAAILSTCNRTEIYLAGADLSHAIVCLAAAAGAREDELVDCLAARAGLDAASHLFAVAAGLESRLLGETQILGQVREALQASREAGGAGPVLAGLFQHALSVGRKTRARTGISRGAASIGSAAVAILRQELLVGAPGIEHVVVVGAGEAAERVLANLRPLGVVRVDVANRTLARAEALVAPPGRALRLDELPAALATADAVVSATGAATTVLRLSEVAPAVLARRGRRLVVLDLAVPRDVEPAIADLPGVTLHDIDAIQDHAAATIERREGEVARARALIAEQVASFDEWLQARRAVGQIVRLRGRAEAMRQEELRRLAPALSERERSAVDRATRTIMRALLHGPTVALRRGDSAEVGDLLAQAFARTRLRDGLDDLAPP